MKRFLMGAAALALVAALPQHARAADAVVATPSKAVSMVLLPKILGICRSTWRIRGPRRQPRS